MNGHDQDWRGRGASTCCVHAGTWVDGATGGVCTPLFPSTAYQFPNPANENVYPRYFNVPNQRAVAAKLAALEHAEDGLVFASGMAAISTVLLGMLGPGDHAVFQRGLYGGTHELVTREIERLGIAVSWAADIGELAGAIRDETKLLYVESPSNPLLRCIDLAAVAALGRLRGMLTVVDNTFATPVNQNPLDLGIDLVVHSATKFLNGHSDLNAGAALGRAEHVQRLLGPAQHFGGMLDPAACLRLERGMKTLALRVARQNDNALQLAGLLAGHPAVARVHYPGLRAHPDHAVAARQMRGFGGMLAFELWNPAWLPALFSRLRLVRPALSLGGVESLACVPARTSHRNLSRAERERAGISDGLVRLSVGIEDPVDLLDDLTHALAACRPPPDEPRDEPLRVMP